MTGAELRAKNRRTMASRDNWPDGAVAVCERLEKAHPGWLVWYRLANTIRGFERPEGYYATRQIGNSRLQVHATNSEVLAALIDVQPAPQGPWP